MVQRDLRRRADNRQRLRGVKAKQVKYGAVGLKVSEVVLLFQPRVAAQFAARPIAVKPLGRNRVGNNDGLREAAVDVVLDGRPFVVEHRRRRNPEHPGGNVDVV
ncbi:unannotated protein [freshwater metagenome]|uniref:Unannotated protein n=1 Tax=freshwater metagenome TaxID=449393 RepID=A0A6J7RR37_9ZZZZ